jgi:hypothetical protein
MNKVLPVFLAVAALTVSAPAYAFAQDGAAPATAQAGDTEAAANEAYKLWKAETDATKKQAMAVDLIKNHFGSKAAEAVGYAGMFTQGTPDQIVLETSRAYYEGAKTSGKQGAYVEYALGNLATREKDSQKLLAYGQEYLQKFPSGKYAEYVQKNIAASRYQMFKQALDAKRWNDAIGVANEAFAAGQNEFVYAYQLAYASLADLTSQGANSPLVGKASGWAERAAKFVESGKMPEGGNAAEWEKAKPATLATLYRIQGIDKLFQTAQSKPTDPAAYEPTIELLNKSATHADKDATTYYFISQARNAQYALWVNRYSALTDEQKTTPEGEALLANVNKAADSLIESYIRVLAYGSNNTALKSTIEPALADVYKYRHPETPDAWRDEVQKLNGGGATTGSASTNAR